MGNILGTYATNWERIGDILGRDGERCEGHIGNTTWKYVEHGLMIWGPCLEHMGNTMGHMRVICGIDVGSMWVTYWETYEHHVGTARE